jgi:hypothetical protein
MKTRRRDPLSASAAAIARARRATDVADTARARLEAAIERYAASLEAAATRVDAIATTAPVTPPPPPRKPAERRIDENGVLPTNLTIEQLRACGPSDEKACRVRQEAQVREEKANQQRNKMRR